VGVVRDTPECVAYGSALPFGSFSRSFCEL
jgi:hypothetical protein